MSKQSSSKINHRLCNNKNHNQESLSPLKLSGAALEELTGQKHLLAKKILANTFGGDGHLKASWDKSL